MGNKKEDITREKRKHLCRWMEDPGGSKKRENIDVQGTKRCARL